MVKNILHIVSWLLLFVYVVVTMGAVGVKMDHRIAKGLVVEIMNNDEADFVDVNEIKNVLQKAGVVIKEQEMNEISSDFIEKELRKQPWLKDVQCYRTVNNAIKINVWQRTPVVRVMTAGSNYYLDEEANKMPPSIFNAAYVPVVTGITPDSLMLIDILDIVKFMNDDRFLKSQIQQLHMNSNGDFVMIPRAGKQEILFGKAERIEGKFYKLKKLYKEEFRENGWNRYRIIDLRFHNQVVCTQK